MAEREAATESKKGREGTGKGPRPTGCSPAPEKRHLGLPAPERGQLCGRHLQGTGQTQTHAQTPPSTPQAVLLQALTPAFSRCLLTA